MKTPLGWKTDNYRPDRTGWPTMNYPQFCLKKSIQPDKYGTITCIKQSLYSDAGNEQISKGAVRMNDIIGIAWYKDESAYQRALAIFTDSKDMPATYEDWQTLIGRECEEIKGAGNIALRADIDPETFTDWCKMHSFIADSQGRTAFVNYIELEYRKTGEGTVIK
jgi:hypothetical protein